MTCLSPTFARKSFHCFLSPSKSLFGSSTAGAAPASGATGGSLTLRSREGEGHVAVEVADSGPGFAQKIIARAFEPYVTTKAKGTGLGLAVVKKIADEHGARLDIANRVEDGVVKGAQVSLSFSVEKLAQT